MVDITRLPEFNELSHGRSNRPETGPMQFGQDWPGIFIRGDSALNYVSIIALTLAELAKRSPDMTRDGRLHRHGLYGLGKLLASCQTGNTGWPPIGGLDVIEDQKNSAEIKEIPGGG